MRSSCRSFHGIRQRDAVEDFIEPALLEVNFVELPVSCRASSAMLPRNAPFTPRSRG